MRGTLAIAALAVLASFVAADVIYLQCPTIFTKSVSNITANYFKNTVPGGQPAPSCVGLNVTIDGADALDTWCVTNGKMGFTLSTPAAKTYTLEGTSTLGPLWGGDGTKVSCTVRRSSFNVSITVPELPLALLPVLALAGVLLLRRKPRAK